MTGNAASTNTSPLPWENLGERPAWEALRDTLRTLARDPRGFFRRMAVSGGLYEPVGFLWVFVAAVILPSFPLALAYFGLTAPAPDSVSVDVYNYHLFFPRATGLLTALLPLALAGAAAWALLCGTLLHLASIPFGGRRWEGAVTVWCYAAGAGMAPVALAAGLGAVVAAASYFAGTVLASAAAVGTYSAYALLSVGCLAGLGWFSVTLLTGCIRALGLPGVRGLASALFGVLLSGIVLVGWPLSGVLWGAQGAGAVAGGLAVAVVFLVSARSGGEA